MKKRSADYALEDLITDSENLLGNMDNVGALIAETQAGAAEEINGEIRKRALESIEEAVELQINGYVELVISGDEMSAVADFYPPTGNMKPVDLDDIVPLLEAKGVTTGEDWDAIKEAVFKCNTDRIQVTDVVVARGVKPVDEIPEHLVIEEELLKGAAEPDFTIQRIDFKEVSPFVLVKAGQVLARRLPKKAGKMGSSVRGEAIVHHTAKPAVLTPGPQTRFEADCVVAACDGRFERGPDSFWVNEVLEISGDIDYRTGHVDFPGDVLIRGEIKDGFKVHSGGSVYCAQTMDASEVISKKDLIVKRGIIGRNKGRVSVAGRVEARFIENCYLDAKEEVIIESGILNSVINTRKQITMGKKGVLIGGKLCAQDGVTAAQIGSRMSPRTEIYCGVDYVVKQKLEWIRDKNIELAIKLRQVENKLKSGTQSGTESASQGNEKLLKIREKIKQAIHQLNEAASSLISGLDKNEDAEVIATGTVFPGVYIEICHFSYIISREMKNVRFRLDKSKGRVIAEII